MRAEVEELLVPEQLPPKRLQADAFENFTLFLCYKSRVLLVLHLCKRPDSVHLGVVFTVSLQDQGRFLLLHQAPGLGQPSPYPLPLDPALLTAAPAQQVSTPSNTASLLY